MSDVAKKVETLMEAMPYLEKYQGKVIVIKYGGNAMINDELKDAVLHDVVMLKLLGLKPVLSHGGGPGINKMLEKLNIPVQFINGLRYTDEETRDVAQMVLAGKLNKDLTAQINAQGGKAVGLCGVDGGMVIVERKGGPVDYGFVGELVKVNPDPITDLLDKGYIPVITSIGMDSSGVTYNINADTMACYVASALKAETIILMTDIRGLLRDKNDETTLIPSVTISQVPPLIGQGIVAGGMIPKVECCVDTLKAGVKKAAIIDGRIVHAILIEMLSDEGIGTMIYHDKKEEA